MSGRIKVSECHLASTQLITEVPHLLVEFRKVELSQLTRMKPSEKHHSSPNRLADSIKIALGAILRADAL